MTEDETYNMIRTTFAWVEKDHRLNDIELAGELRILYGTTEPGHQLSCRSAGTTCLAA